MEVITQEILDQYFDRIYIISFVKNYSDRERIVNELNNLGITKFEFIYTYDISENVIKFPHNLSAKHFSVSFTHYNLLKTCKELGLNRILVFEDDVHFLIDKQVFINNVLDGINQDLDIILYDYMRCNGDNMSYAYLLQSGYAVNQKGMEFYIKNFENSQYIIDNYLYFYVNTTELFADCIFTSNFEEGYYQLEKSTLDTKVGIVPVRLCYQPQFVQSHIWYGEYDIPMELYQ